MAQPLASETLLEMPEMPEMPPSMAAGNVSQTLRLLRSSMPEAFRSRLRSARELDRETRDAAGEGAFVTAVPALDRLLDGGLPRGQLVELVGGRSSGRFSTLLAVLAAATSVGEAAALVDLGDGLDPTGVLALGADLQRLLWLRPTTLKDALASTEMLLASGFPLVVLDLGQPPVRGGRGVEAAWLRLARAARAHDAALLVGAPYRVSGTAAGVVLKAERARATWMGQGASPRLLAECSSHLILEKRRGQLPGRTEGFTLAAPGAPRPAVTAPVLPEARPRVREERAPLVAAPPLRRAAAG